MTESSDEDIAYLLNPLRVAECSIIVLGSFLLVASAPWIIGFGALCVLATYSKQIVQRRSTVPEIVAKTPWQPLPAAVAARSRHDATKEFSP
jgi:hypothetical protein